MYSRPNILHRSTTIHFYTCLVKFKWAAQGFSPCAHDVRPKSALSVIRHDVDYQSHPSLTPWNSPESFSLQLFTSIQVSFKPAAQGVSPCAHDVRPNNSALPMIRHDVHYQSHSSLRLETYRNLFLINYPFLNWSDDMYNLRYVWSIL